MTYIRPSAIILNQSPSSILVSRHYKYYQEYIILYFLVFLDNRNINNRGCSNMINHIIR